MLKDLHTSKKSLYNLLASFFILLGILWIFFLGDNFTKIPIDYKYEADVLSVDNFYTQNFDIQNLSKSKFIYEVVDSHPNDKNLLYLKSTFSSGDIEGNIVFQTSTTTLISNLGFTNKQSNYRNYIFAPSNLKEKNQFEYWHIYYDRPLDMKYIGKDTLYGLDVYRYESMYSDLGIYNIENIPYIENSDPDIAIKVYPHITLWIEPQTGNLINFADDGLTYFYDLKEDKIIKPWNRYSTVFNEKSIKENVNDTLAQKSSILIFKFYIPIILILLGLIMFIFNIFDLDKLFENNNVKKIKNFTGLILIYICTFSLIGWILGSEIMVRLVPYSSAINPVTAVCFGIIGIVLIFNERIYKKLYVLLALLISIIGFLKLGEEYLSINYSVDLIIFKDAVLNYHILSRMAEYTALCFFLLGFVLIALINKNKILKRIALIFTTTIFIISIFSIFSFFIDSIQIIKLPLFFSSAIHTSVIFLILSFVIYLVLRQTDKDTLELKGWVITSSTIVICFLFTIMFSNILDKAYINESQDKFINNTNKITSDLKENIDRYINLLENTERYYKEIKVKDTEDKTIFNNYAAIEYFGHVESNFIDDRENFINYENEIYAKKTLSKDFLITLNGNEDFINQLNNAKQYNKTLLSDNIVLHKQGYVYDDGSVRMTDNQGQYVNYIALIDPIYDDDDNFGGYLIALINAEVFFNSFFNHNNINNISLSVSDDLIANFDIYNRTNNLDEIRENNLLKNEAIFFGGKVWTLSYSSSINYDELPYRKFSNILVISTGLFVTLLITGIIFLFSSTKRKAVKYAIEVTKDLRESIAKVESIIASLGEGLVATNEKGKIVVANNHFLSMFGITEKEIIGRSLDRIIPTMKNDEAVGEECYDDLVFKTIKNEESSDSSDMNKTIYFEKKDGNEFPVHITVSPIFLGTKIIGAVAIFRDITKEKAIDKAKTEFVSLASHQLRTPLSTINWYTEMLINGDAGKVNKKQLDYLNEIYTGNQRMVHLVNSLLDVSRLELGTFVITPQKIDSIKIINEVVKELKTQFKDKKIKLKKEIGVIPKIYFDPKLFRIIIENLLTNAMKYSPQSTQVKLSYKKIGNNVVLEVEDKGYGIPTEEIPKIFQKLYRASNITPLDTQGTGLGLYIVKNIINTAGGTIICNSRINKGTIFTAKLPIKPNVKKLNR